MISASIQADSLPLFYERLCAAQEAAHGPGYCSHHRVIRQAAQDCCSYAELGVNQGATLACALLAGFDRVVGVDVALAPFRAYEALFRGWAGQFGAELDVREQDSREPLGEVVDFLLIDSLHEGSHLMAELDVHAPFVRRQILIHDTARYPGLELVAKAFVSGSRWKVAGWTVQQVESRGYGWTLLSRQA